MDNWVILKLTVGILTFLEKSALSIFSGKQVIDFHDNRELSIDYPGIEYEYPPIVPNYGEYFFPDVNIRQTIIRQPRQNNSTLDTLSLKMK